MYLGKRGIGNKKFSILPVPQNFPPFPSDPIQGFRLLRAARCISESKLPKIKNPPAFPADPYPLKPLRSVKNSWGDLFSGPAQGSEKDLLPPGFFRRFCLDRPFAGYPFFFNFFP
jgi:hypothetical protein